MSKLRGVVAQKRPTEDVAPLVRTMMKDYQLSREQVAAEIGVTGVAVWYWLHGAKALPLYAERVRETVARLARKRARAKS